MSSSRRPKAEEPCPSSKTVRQRESILSFSAFCSIWAFNGLDKAHPARGGDLLYSAHPSARSTHSRAPSRPPQIQCSTKRPEHLLAQPGRWVKLAMTFGLCSTEARGLTRYSDRQEKNSKRKWLSAGGILTKTSSFSSNSTSYKSFLISPYRQ